MQNPFYPTHVEDSAGIVQRTHLLRRVGVSTLALVISFLLFGFTFFITHENAFAQDGGGIINCVTLPCVDNPLDWQQSTLNVPVDILGGTIEDEANRLQLRFPPAAVQETSSMVYTATTMGDFFIGESISLRYGEILGVFELDATALVSDTNGAVQEGDPTQLMQEWTLWFNYGGCATPIGCELAFYDMASMSCLWWDPELETWTPIESTVDTRNHVLNCSSDTLGTHAFAARRAQTSGEEEGPQIYLPLVIQ